MKIKAVTGATRLLGLLGDPVSHSLSPALQNHALAQTGINCIYVPLGCREESLADVICGLKGLNFLGVNVTIPFKDSVVKYCDSLSPLSELTGTVNTVVNRDGSLYGTTTDAEGFLGALKEDGFDLSGRNMTICGNGGTARTLAMVCAYENIPSSITLVGRSKDRLETLAQEVYKKTGFSVSSMAFDDADIDEHLAKTDIVVNTTSLGMGKLKGESPLRPDQFRSDCYYFDAVYNPAQTAFLSYASSAGASCQNGLRMLLLQGLASFRLWTGADCPIDSYNLQELQQLASA